MRKLRRDLQATRNLRRDLLESRVVFGAQPISRRVGVGMGHSGLVVSSTKSRGEAAARIFISRRKRKGLLTARRGRELC